MKRFLAIALLGLSIPSFATQPPAGDRPPTGDLHIAHRLPSGFDSSYRLYVPENWKPGDRWPLVTILHGGGGDENSPFDRTPGFREKIEAAARRHHFILLSPRGNKGWFGARMIPEGDARPIGPGIYRWPPAGAITGPSPRLPPLSDEDLAVSEEDAIATADAVRQAYGTDPARNFLVGNSAGSIATLHLVQAHPGRWCAIAPSDGPMDPATYPYARARGAIRAALFVHGDDDRTAPIESMRTIAEGFRGAGVPTRFITVKGGAHDTSWHIALPRIFSFFASQRCPAQR
ncbi:hypothetical protein [Sphingomonas sp.]|uniref:hypothetical protein n=1 Tax=Sphingomonas sp. TaxID=28214 RepID=UPI000DB35360|nr:hypothetical protein [Sphingomonas sp.]PZU10956.1 MAG: hypothetical protein DI605_04945 [Sphingomonas sp.]